MTEKRCAIVTYTMRKAAEEAASNLYKKLKIKGCSLKLWWARALCYVAAQLLGAIGAALTLLYISRQRSLIGCSIVQ